MPYTKQQQEYLDIVYRESMNQGVNPALAASVLNPDDDITEGISRLRETLKKHGKDIMAKLRH